MLDRMIIGEWRVDAAAGTIARGSETVRVEERTLRVLVCLAVRRGQTVSSEELLEAAWPGVAVSQDSVYQAVASLRRALGDDSRQPAYIVTVPRQGYRLVAEVGPWPNEPVEAPPMVPEPAPQETKVGAEGNDFGLQPSGARPAAEAEHRRWLSGGRIAWAAAVILLLLAGWRWALPHARSEASGQAGSAAHLPLPARSIAVVPFLDLTEGMKEGEFADGMTEELIGKLSRIPGLRVSGPTASFYYKDKQVTPAEMGRVLGVVYLLDGSVRKAGKRLRVSARLLRADTSYVVWTENYDRPLDDILKLQDEIAGEVTKALRGSLNGGLDGGSAGSDHGSAGGQSPATR